jgi:predicted Fe-Mo cluster-binding NifX family protein
MKETLEVVDFLVAIAKVKKATEMFRILDEANAAIKDFRLVQGEIAAAGSGACEIIVEHMGAKLGNDNMYVAKIGCKAYDFLQNYMEMATLRKQLAEFRKENPLLAPASITPISDLKETADVWDFATELPTRNNIFHVLGLFWVGRSAVVGFNKVASEIAVAGDTYDAKLITYFKEKFGDDTFLSADIARKADNMLQNFLELCTLVGLYWEASKNNLVAIPTPKIEEVQAIIAPVPRKLKVAAKKKTQDDFVESNLL